MDLADAYRNLDPDAAPELVWLTGEPPARAVLLLGAFDPPTRAHVALCDAAAEQTRLPAAFCLTKVLLDRPEDGWLPPELRLELLAALGRGLTVANRGTYRDVAHAAQAAGIDPVFVIGSDKLTQLRDPRFYPDAERGVDATFAECRFLVVPRGADAVPADVDVLHAFDEPALARISASEVRRRIAKGEPIDDLVPPVVALALGRYTRSSDRT